MYKAIIFIVVFILAISCSDKEDPIGKWDDIIKLSAKNVMLSAGPDSVIITTKGDWWWVDGIWFEDSVYQYYGRDDINLESESYTIQEEHFIVGRRNKNTLFVKIDENTSEKERIMHISLEAGDYFDDVYINQAP